MSDTPTTPDPSPEPSLDALRIDDVPTAKPASPAAPGAYGPRPIFEVEEDRCPKCGAAMDTTAVVCLKCGYDQRANTVREVETGTVEEAAPVIPESDKEFVIPGRLNPKVLGIIGGVVTVAAMVAAGAFAPTGSTAMVIVGLVVLTLYRIALHTATGVAAVAIAAKLEGQKFGRGDFAVGRMFLCFAIFQFFTSLHLPMWWGLSMALTLLVGAGAYFGLLMILFQKDRATAALVALSHFVLWILLNAGMELSGLISKAAIKSP